MPVDPNYGQRLRELREQLRRTQTITPELMADVIGGICSHRATVKAKILHLIESKAFADATLALLELELAQWNLRRLIYEDGEWHCAISKHLGLAIELDDMAEAHHENLPLAILSAFVEARHRSLTALEGPPKSVPEVRLTQGYTICCDNFA